MGIPDFQTIMLPLLKHLNDQQEHRMRDVIVSLYDILNLNDDDKYALSGSQQPIIDNRIGWARTYLKKARLLEAPRRGYVKITGRGLEILKTNPQKIDVKFLEQYPEFVEFKSPKMHQNGTGVAAVKDETEKIDAQTPDEMMESGYELIKANLGQELLNTLMIKSPDFFEAAVIKLISAMGYGEGKVTGRSGDGGIDGIINQDSLGIDKIFLQAKRFSETNSVSASMIRDFVGTLELNSINKGVFITTSKFPKNTNDVVSRSHKSIILIDGNYLVQLMMHYNVGVNTKKTYEVKKIDLDFFDED